MRAALGGFSVFAMDPNGADAYWAGRFGLGRYSCAPASYLLRPCRGSHPAASRTAK